MPAEHVGTRLNLNVQTGLELFAPTGFYEQQTRVESPRGNVIASHNRIETGILTSVNDIRAHWEHPPYHSHLRTHLSPPDSRVYHHLRNKSVKETASARKTPKAQESTSRTACPRLPSMSMPLQDTRSQSGM
ncbi:hypothetical protein BS47DRAFT_1397060 [Hydnum rufescens UP504]|uniref:Uncharacterized protein n=1 Tax=Hydnum rufescens UP504 TaxID=1448309 RepID=A0A9P6DPR3_9AGAM|nr:hypothetical protein BS47DRAFT_1397060 [Hydnum rufescens UP504]